MMVCVSTSYTLLDSVLSQAGQSIKSQYKDKCRSKNIILLDGGDTSAKQILFIAWELRVGSSDQTKAQRVNYLSSFKNK
jgi:hypothetical protein